MYMSACGSRSYEVCPPLKDVKWVWHQQCDVIFGKICYFSFDLLLLACSANFIKLTFAAVNYKIFWWSFLCPHLFVLDATTSQDPNLPSLLWSSSCGLSNGSCCFHEWPPYLSILCSMIGSCQTNVEWNDIIFYLSFDKRLTGKNISKMTYFVSSGMLNVNWNKQSVYFRLKTLFNLHCVFVYCCDIRFRHNRCFTITVIL